MPMMWGESLLEFGAMATAVSLHMSANTPMIRPLSLTRQALLWRLYAKKTQARRTQYQKKSYKSEL